MEDMVFGRDQSCSKKLLSIGFMCFVKALLSTMPVLYFEINIYIYIRVSNMGTEITTYGCRSARCDGIVPGRIFVFDPKFHCTEYGKDDIE